MKDHDSFPKMMDCLATRHWGGRGLMDPWDAASISSFCSFSGVFLGNHIFQMFRAVSWK